MRIGWKIAVCAGAALLIGGCGGSPRPAPPKPAAEPRLATVVVEPAKAPAERLLDGVVEAVNHATVAAQTSGRVAAVYFDVGDYVSAGAVILRLRATEQHAGLIQAEASLSEARARSSEAQTRYSRIADMYDRQVVPKATLDQALADRDAAAARLSAARAAVLNARQGVDYTEIRAPYSGVVTQRLVQVGETVSPGTPLMSGLSLQHLRVVVDIPQSITEAVRRNMAATIYLDGRRITAAKVTLFPVASTPSNTFRAWLDLPEGVAGFRPGMLVKAGFVIGERERLLVPEAAIVRRSEVTAVYLVHADGGTSMQQVRLGERFADQVEVLSGLMPGDRIAEDPLAAVQRLEPAGAGGLAQ